MSEMEKAAARKAAFTRRKTAFAEARVKVPRATEHLLALLGDVSGRVVSGYMPIRTEMDPLPAMTSLAACGARICVPVIAGAGEPLDFREWTPDTAMIEGPFGARVPERGDWLVPDVLIVPLVAFDLRLMRLGYGGGFYDRTLARLRAAGPVMAVGFAYAAQAADALATEPTDEPLDAVVTEAGVLRA